QCTFGIIQPRLDLAARGDVMKLQETRLALAVERLAAVEPRAGARLAPESHYLVGRRHASSPSLQDGQDAATGKGRHAGRIVGRRAALAAHACATVPGRALIASACARPLWWPAPPVTG